MDGHTWNRELGQQGAIGREFHTFRWMLPPLSTRRARPESRLARSRLARDTLVLGRRAMPIPDKGNCNRVGIRFIPPACQRATRQPHAGMDGQSILKRRKGGPSPLLSSVGRCSILATCTAATISDWSLLALRLLRLPNFSLGVHLDW